MIEALLLVMGVQTSDLIGNWSPELGEKGQYESALCIINKR